MRSSTKRSSILLVAGISICVYEYFMTFQDEVFYMWTKAPKPKFRVATPLRAIFFYSRYGILFVITFSLSTSKHGLKHFLNM